tara:strand:- start:929 stop:1279 length:351 start_codon:yes stop_codon:yes gene_type:complete
MSSPPSAKRAPSVECAPDDTVTVLVLDHGSSVANGDPAAMIKRTRLLVLPKPTWDELMKDTAPVWVANDTPHYVHDRLSRWLEECTGQDGETRLEMQGVDVKPGAKLTCNAVVYDA